MLYWLSGWILPVGNLNNLRHMHNMHSHIILKLCMVTCRYCIYILALSMLVEFNFQFKSVMFFFISSHTISKLFTLLDKDPTVMQRKPPTIRRTPISTNSATVGRKNWILTGRNLCKNQAQGGANICCGPVRSDWMETGQKTSCDGCRWVCLFVPKSLRVWHFDCFSFFKWMWQVKGRNLTEKPAGHRSLKNSLLIMFHSKLFYANVMLL